ncbi:hypothetical protein EDC94DRAFT_584532 [Helicostylum pulchrum]|nr:hypothetical protein EDC94DRAFT_584532 [Helicostylum pulchrum]
MVGGCLVFSWVRFVSGILLVFRNTKNGPGRSVDITSVKVTEAYSQTFCWSIASLCHNTLTGFLLISVQYFICLNSTPAICEKLFETLGGSLSQDFGSIQYRVWSEISVSVKKRLDKGTLRVTQRKGFMRAICGCHKEKTSKGTLCYKEKA